MNQSRSNARTTERTKGSGDAPLWQGLVQNNKEDANLRQALNRWQAKDDVHPHGGPKVTQRRERKIVGSSRHLLGDQKKPSTPPMLTPKPVSAFSGDASGQHTELVPIVPPVHQAARPSVSPKRISNMGGLDVPSLNLKKQRSLRQPNEVLDLRGVVARSRSEQATSSRPAVIRKVVAKRGLSVRRLPSAEFVRDPSSHRAPQTSSSFISASGTAQLENLDEEENSSEFASPTRKHDASIRGRADEKTTKHAITTAKDSVQDCPSSPTREKGLPYLTSSPVGGGLSQPTFGTPTRRDSISPVGRNQRKVSDIVNSSAKDISCLSPKLHVVSQHGRVELQTKSKSDFEVGGFGVTRSKSDQVSRIAPHDRIHNRTGGPSELRKSFAMRGLSVRNLPGSNHGGRSIASRTAVSRPSCPSRTTSFASVTTSLATTTESPVQGEVIHPQENLTLAEAGEEGMLTLHEEPSEQSASPRKVHEKAQLSKPCPNPQSTFSPKPRDIDISQSTFSPKPRDIDISIPHTSSVPGGSGPASRSRSLSPRPQSRQTTPSGWDMGYSPKSESAGNRGKSEMARKSAPTDLPVAVLSMPQQAVANKSPGIHQKDFVAPVRTDAPREITPNFARPNVSPTRSTRSMRSVLTRSPSKSTSRSPMRSRSKSPMPNQRGARPNMSKRLMSLRSIVSVNTNVAVSEEVYPNKAKRPSAIAPASLRREGSGESYVAKATQRKSLLSRLGDSFRLAASAVLEDDDVTRTSMEDDASNFGGQNGKPKAIVKRQASRSALRTPDVPEPAVVVQKQHERRRLLTRLSRRDMDEKTECCSISKGGSQGEQQQQRAEPPHQVDHKRDSYIPEYIYFREYSSLEDNPDDASLITEAFTLVCDESESQNGNDAPSLPSKISTVSRRSPVKSPMKGSSSSACEVSILGELEPSNLEMEMEEADIIDSLLNSSPRPTLNIPRLMSLRTQSIRTKTVFNLEESDGSLYVDTTEQKDREKEEGVSLEDSDAYISEVLKELEKAKPPIVSSDESTTTGKTKKNRKSRKMLRQLHTADRVLIEL